MPVAYSCREHPTVSGPLAVVAAHVSSSHRGVPFDSLAEVTFVSQAVAQGNPERRRFFCRRCLVTVDTIEPDDGALLALCDACKAADG